MINDNPVCCRCEAHHCHPALTPIHTSGKPPWDNLGCRHFSCKTGEDAAAAAKDFGTPQKTLVHVADADGADHALTIEAMPFGSNEKPIGTRIVDEQTGLIFSKQDGEWFCTGQVCSNEATTPDPSATLLRAYAPFCPTVSSDT